MLAPLDVPLVIDHMARVQARDGVAYASFARLQAYLALPHLWIKLWGPDRITDGIAPYPDAVRVRPCAAGHRPRPRAIWGTDSPHPNIRYPRPDEAQLLAWIRALCGDAATADAVLRHNPARLYA